MEKIAKFIGTGDADFNRWKRKNVTVRGVKEMGKENQVYGSFGKGLYTAFLSNVSMAKGYGKVYYVVNAIPKHPKVVNSVNYAEMFVQSLVKDVCDKHNQPYSVNFFNQHSTIEDEAMKKGFDGLIIKGREMVNYKPPQDVKYFDSLDNLYEYYKDTLNRKMVNKMENVASWLSNTITPEAAIYEFEETVLSKIHDTKNLFDKRKIENFELSKDIDEFYSEVDKLAKKLINVWDKKLNLTHA